MAYFPFFMDMAGKRCLIVGGGTVALRKAEKILPFGPSITVISETISEEMEKLGVETIERAYMEGDEESYDFVIAATDDRETNRTVSERCIERKIPINAVDDQELCSFIFPTYVKRGDLTVGISTSGASPTAAIALKEKISEMLPDTFGDILTYLHASREKIKKTVGSEHERHIILKALYEAAMEKGRPLTDEETDGIWRNE